MKFEIEIEDESVIINMAMAKQALACEFNIAAVGLHREPMPLTVVQGLFEQLSAAYFLLANAFYAKEIKTAAEGCFPSPV